MLLKINEVSLLTRPKVLHRLGGKVGNMWAVEHPPEGCECMLLHSLRHATWVSYNQIQGVVACDRCKAEELVPCPAVKAEEAGYVYMDVAAVADDISRFGAIHENCLLVPVIPSTVPDEVVRVPGDRRTD